MCRGTQNCSVLGNNPNKWSKEAPLLPPAWFDEQLTIFANAANLAASGEVAKARDQLRLIRNTDLQTWYIEHGQQSGIFRHRFLGSLPVKIVDANLDPIKQPQKDLESAVFERDSYQCRYCNLRLIPKNVLEVFSKTVGSDVFRPTGTNSQRHGVVLAFRANADHVVPHKIGGRTDLQNLVTCCWCCNYGKGPFTLEQIGLDDPRSRSVHKHNDWDGLTTLLPKLRLHARRWFNKTEKIIWIRLGTKINMM